MLCAFKEKMFGKTIALNYLKTKGLMSNLTEEEINSIKNSLVKQVKGKGGILDIGFYSNLLGLGVFNETVKQKNKTNVTHIVVKSSGGKSTRRDTFAARVQCKVPLFISGNNNNFPDDNRKVNLKLEKSSIYTVKGR